MKLGLKELNHYGEAINGCDLIDSNQYNKLYNSLHKYDCLIIDSTNPWVKLTLSEGLPLLLNKKVIN